MNQEIELEYNDKTTPVRTAAENTLLHKDMIQYLHDQLRKHGIIEDIDLTAYTIKKFIRVSTRSKAKETAQRNVLNAFVSDEKFTASRYVSVPNGTSSYNREFLIQAITEATPNTILIAVNASRFGRYSIKTTDPIDLATIQYLRVMCAAKNIRFMLLSNKDNGNARSEEYKINPVKHIIKFDALLARMQNAHELYIQNNQHIYSPFSGFKDAKSY